MTAFPLAPPAPLAVSLVAPSALADLVFALERGQDAAAADALIDRAFGPGRFAKTAERLREGNHLRADLSVCAWDGDRLVGVVRQWPVLVGDQPAVFLGPFAVDDAWRHRGLGRALIERALGLSDATGERLTVLVGAQSYFGPLGFVPVPRGRVTLPGPVDPRRLLWRPAGPAEAESASGSLRVPSGPLRR